MGLPMWNNSPKAGQSDEEASSKLPVNINNSNTRNPALPSNGNIHNPSPFSSLPSSSSPSTSSTSASTLTGNADDRNLRWERLHSLRNRLVDRMYRLEMEEMNSREEMHNNHHANSPENIENREGSPGAATDTQSTSVTSTTRPIPIVIASRRPIPGRRMEGLIEANTGQSWPEEPPSSVSLNRGEIFEVQEYSTRTEDGRLPESLLRRSSGRDARRRTEDTRRILETRRRAIDRLQAAENRGSEALITLDEFLRESQTRDPTTDNDESGPVTSGPHRSSSIPPINRIRASNHFLDVVRPTDPDDASQSITVPQTLPAATWWPSYDTPPPGHHMAPNETFDTFINHIRRIGHLQDAMLATIRSSNSTLAASASVTNSARPPGDASAAPASTIPGAPNSTAQISAMPRTGFTAPGDANAVFGTTPPPSLNVAEARLRAMQTRIEILTSEFSLLRSSWALSHAEGQGYERSLRRLQEYLPSARRAERVRRGNRGGEVSLHYEDLHADAAAREADYPRNPWGDSDAERNRERMRTAAVWALGRDRLSGLHGEGMGSTGSTGGGNRETAQVSGGEVATVQSTPPPPPPPPAQTTAEPFSAAEREVQKELLEMKMEELTLRELR